MAAFVYGAGTPWPSLPLGWPGASRIPASTAVPTMVVVFAMDHHSRSDLVTSGSTVVVRVYAVAGEQRLERQDALRDREVLGSRGRGRGT